jgi:small subunit ribosomal protein S15
MTLTKDVKTEIVKKFGASETDTGSAEVQVALLTQRINDLTEHFKLHSKDFAGRRGLLRLVGRRRSLLANMRKNDVERYRKLIQELGLRK